MLFRRAWIALYCVLVALGCGPSGLRLEGGGQGRNVSLRFEGTCGHLACCSAYAVGVPVRTHGAFDCEAEATARCTSQPGWFAPGFTCSPGEVGRYRQPDDPAYLDCNDNERWLSIPGLLLEQCGETFLVCHRGRRVTAVARDRSAANASGHRHFEGSLGLVRALGADPAERETVVSVYRLTERDQIAADPQCAGAS